MPQGAGVERYRRQPPECHMRHFRQVREFNAAVECREITCIYK
jgi:hypothetical protein